jgi:hypothetical protein
MPILHTHTNGGWTELGHRTMNKCFKKVKCELFGGTVSRQYLKNHQTTRKCQVDRESYKAPADEIFHDNEPPEPERDVLPVADHRVSMPTPVEAANCPVPSCLAHPPTRSKMLRHFRNIHSRDDRLIITEEGLLPRCGNCGLFQRNVIT